MADRGVKICIASDSLAAILSIAAGVASYSQVAHLSFWLSIAGICCLVIAQVNVSIPAYRFRFSKRESGMCQWLTSDLALFLLTWFLSFAGGLVIYLSDKIELIFGGLCLCILHCVSACYYFRYAPRSP